MRLEFPAWYRAGIGILIAGLCGLLAVGIATAGMSSWQLSRNRLTAALFWEPGSPAALIKQADRFLLEGRRADAAATARRAVREAPMMAAPVRILALSTDDDVERSLLMRQAGKLSQRDIPSQVWLMEDAARRADAKAAAFHADMLLRRQGVNESAVFIRLMALLDTDAGRRAVADRLSLHPAWRGDFLRTAGRYGEPDQVGAMLLQLRARSGAFPDGELNRFFNRLFAEGRYAEARTYWLGLTDADSTSLVYDGQFDGRSGPPPLNWSIMKRRGGQGALGVKDGAPPGMLRLKYDGMSPPESLAIEFILLRPGAYRVEARLGPLDPDAAGRFHLRVDCLRGGLLVDAPLGQSGRLTQAEFTVEPACQAQKLTFWPIPGERRQDLAMLVDSLSIRPVR